MFEPVRDMLPSNLKRATSIVFLLLVAAAVSIAADGRPPVRHTAQEDYFHYSSVGNFGLTTTNYGILGEGYNNEDQPSARYKIRFNLFKESVEHFSFSGIWLGGEKSGVSHVSTAIMDGIFEYNEGGKEFTSSATDKIEWNPIFEHLAKIDRRFDLSGVHDGEGEVVFGGALNAPIENGLIDFGNGNTAWDSVLTRSSISDASPANSYWRYAQFYDPNAISHQDLICAYTDTNTFVPGTGIAIPNHQPLGVHVYQEAYAWNHSFADAFTIVSYTITNIPTGWEFAETDTTVDYGNGIVRTFAPGDTIWKGQPIIAPFFGIWVDASIGNPYYTDPYNSQGGPGGRWNWYDNLNNFDRDRRMGLQYDYDGDAGWAESYLGVKVLGAEPRTEDYDVYYHQWTWRGSSFATDWPMPQNEEERYAVMGTHSAYANIPTSEDYIQSWMMMISCGPMPDMAPGERYNVALAFIAGRWNGGGNDTEDRRRNLNLNAEWAQIAYNGEDRNGNGVLDAGEDADGDGRITRYILPEAPPSPSMVLVPGDNQVTLYWNDEPESTIDPISNKHDFEGYRIYGAPKTDMPDSLASEWTLLADYDVDYDIEPSDDDTVLVGYNLGLDAVRLDEPVLIDGQEMNYRWVNEGVKNGWPRELYYSITSYDRGDPANNLASLESSVDGNQTYAFPGTPPTEEGDDRIGVYPNPYIGRAAWDGLTGRDRLIWFRHLPPKCEISIFTLAGERVDRFRHDSATYSGEDVARISTGTAPGERRAFSGGEHAWDLLTEDDQEIATGLYIYTVEDLRNGDVKTGKFLVIK
ncbi:hypothetical protein KQI63_07205 [bacterium]|nr:hypothetical protein [bacterium]